MRLRHARKAGVQFSTLPLNCYGLDFTDERTMPLDFHLSYALDSEHVAVESYAVPVTWESDAIETTTRFKTRVPRFLTTLDSAKE